MSEQLQEEYQDNQLEFVENNIEEIQEEEQPQSQERDYEAEARAQGWTDNFKGDPSKKKTAKQFVEDAEKHPALQKANYNRIAEDNKILAEQVKKLQEKQRAFQESFIKNNTTSIDKEINQYFEDGNQEAFKEAQKRKHDLLKQQIELENEAKQTQQPQAPLVSQEIIEWVNNKSWWNTDVELRNYAIQEDNIIRQKYPGISDYDALNMLDYKINQLQTKKPSFNAVSGGQQTVSKKKTSSITWDSLSDEDKKIINVNVRNNIYTKEEALKAIQNEYNY